jgi:hypothetical protein
MAEETREFPEVSFIRKLVPFPRALSLWPTHVSAVSPLQAIILRDWDQHKNLEGTHIENIAILN